MIWEVIEINRKTDERKPVAFFDDAQFRESHGPERCSEIAYVQARSAMRSLREVAAVEGRRVLYVVQGAIT